MVGNDYSHPVAVFAARHIVALPTMFAEARKGPGQLRHRADCGFSRRRSGRQEDAYRENYLFSRHRA